MYKVLIVTLVMAAPVPAAAQSLSAEAAAQKARVESLLPAYTSAREALRVRDSVRAAARRNAGREPLDTVHIPPFRIVTQRSLSDELVPVVREVLSDEYLRSLQGIENAQPLTLLVQREVYGPFHEMGKQPRHYLVSLYSDKAGRRRQAVTQVLDNAVVAMLPAVVEAWLVDPNLTTGRDRESVYRHLATRSAKSAQRCYAGSVEDCITALGLGERLDSLNGYSPDQIRALVARGAGSGGARARSDCVQGRDLSACIAVFASHGGVPLPIGSIARASLLAFAIEQGGTGSIARLAASHGDVGAAIASAANRPLDAVVADWRAEILSARPDTGAQAVKASFAGLIWISIASMFMMRSTRRRTR